MTGIFTEQYSVGDRDERPWGHYVVTGVGRNAAGEEFCTKDITVHPGGILSLQSHEHRREHWLVKSGELTVILDADCLTLQPGQGIDIPLGAIHCMANLGSQPCVVAEKQEGICREADIHRYVDANGRQTEPPPGKQADASVRLYKDLMARLAAAS